MTRTAVLNDPNARGARDGYRPQARRGGTRPLADPGRDQEPSRKPSREPSPGAGGGARIALCPRHLLRDPEAIRVGASDALHAVVALGAEFAVEQFGRTTLARTGSVALIDLGSPYVIDSRKGGQMVCMAVAGRDLKRRLRGPEGAPVSLILPTGIGGLAAAYIEALSALPEDLGALAETINDHVVDLLVVAAREQAHGAPRAHCPDERLLSCVRTLIDDEIANPALSSKLICHRLGISRSKLFDVLAKGGTSLSACIRQERLRRVTDDLKDPRCNHLTVAEVARRWGYDDPASFSRAFKKAYGCPPGSLRG